MIRSKQSLSHYHLLTAPMGTLIPLTWFEALPGDSIQQRTSLLLRCQPLLHPIMHPVAIRIHHYFVPNRLIWEDWEDFITGGEDGLDASVHPFIRVNGALSEGCLCDHLGVPPKTYTNFDVSALPARAYQLIFNEHYRDQQLVTASTISKASGQDSTTDLNLKNVAWQKDYFTTCRPDESLGAEITIPLTGDAPVTGLGVASTSGWTTGPVNAYETDGSAAESYAKYKNLSSVSSYAEEDTSNTGYPNIRADLSAVSGVKITDLREALGLQRYQEARNAYGARYVEYLRYLGVRSSDARLQNPEYLGGGRQVIQFSEVLSTDGANTGDLKGHGIAGVRTNRYRRFFEEHGIVMSLMSVIPKPIYADAIHRGFLRETKEDYYQKELANIGEQEVLNKEVQVDHSTPDDVFGYQDRYDEYRSPAALNSISGEFHSTRNDWHMARIYSGDQGLNSSWVTATPTTRIFAAPSTDALIIMASHSVQARRMMTKKAVKKTF